MPKISIIICTYNPDFVVFSNCIRYIDNATNHLENFEIIIIDNHSNNDFHEFDFIKEIKERINSKVITEPKPGLTAARLRGIKESKGDLLVFVDDDNLVAPDFFEKVHKINLQYPWIGSFSGCVSIICNKPIPEWTRKYWGMLVHREFSGNFWTNVHFDQQCMPCGAGMVVTRPVADYYLNLVESGQRKIQLDRVEKQLLSGGDNDLAMCACDLGLGMGLFSELKLEHLLSENRFEFTYLKNLTFNIYFSAELLKGMRGVMLKNGKILKYYLKLLNTFFLNYKDGAIQRASIRGSFKGINYYNNKLL